MISVAPGVVIPSSSPFALAPYLQVAREMQLSETCFLELRPQAGGAGGAFEFPHPRLELPFSIAEFVFRCCCDGELLCAFLCGEKKQIGDFGGERG